MQTALYRYSNWLDRCALRNISSMNHVDNVTLEVPLEALNIDIPHFQTLESSKELDDLLRKLELRKNLRSFDLRVCSLVSDNQKNYSANISTFVDGLESQCQSNISLLKKQFSSQRVNIQKRLEERRVSSVHKSNSLSVTKLDSTYISLSKIREFSRLHNSSAGSEHHPSQFNRRASKMAQTVHLLSSLETL